ncbi:facilitated trehalose transporter Tret1-like [Bombyx mandarina]|uniref:Facilitated trehalose transporter Tret1-like n=1 Tax=Bombyx mandarina TaxID=7092 RepID=A0A6J2KTM0_BOMMA|nr:facilitated trehalose transporter Tret1-like [Bombyx mandarina]
MPKITPYMKQCFVTTAIGFNIIGHGAASGFPAILLPQLHKPDSGFKLTRSQDSWLASTVGLTLLLGSFSAASVMGTKGRKAAHYTISVLGIVGWVITILATSFWLLIVGRIILGISFVMMIPLRSALIGEYTSPKSRGAFLATVSLAQGFGIFFVHLIGSLISWQRTALVCLFLPFISLVMTLFSPESPSWLASQGRYEESREAFRWLRGDQEEDELEKMISARIAFQESRQGRKITMFGTIKKKEFYKPIILMFHAYSLSQSCGLVTMAAFSTIIIKNVMGDVNADMWMVIFDTERILTNTLAVFIIHKFKRRTMMFSAGGLSLASHIGVIFYIYLRNNNSLPVTGIWLPALLLALQFFAMSVGVTPMPSVMAGEVFPLQYRSLAGSISLVSLSSTMFLILKTFTGLIDSVGIEGTYAVYSFSIVYCLLVMWFLMPETKGRTLQEIEDGFRGKPIVTRELIEKKSLKDDETELETKNLT